MILGIFGSSCAHEDWKKTKEFTNGRLPYHSLDYENESFEVTAKKNARFKCTECGKTKVEVIEEKTVVFTGESKQ